MCSSEQIVEQTVELPVIWDAIVLVTDIIVVWLMNHKEMYVTPVCKQWKFISFTLIH